MKPKLKVMFINFKLQMQSPILSVMNETEMYGTDINGIILEEEEGEDDVEVGRFELLYFPNTLRFNLFEQLDMINQYIFDFAQEMYEDSDNIKDEYSFIENEAFSLIILKKIEINKEYRGKGILKECIEFIDHIFKSTPIIAKPFPLQFDGIDKPNIQEFKPALKRVREAYTKCGFVKTRKNTEYMIYNKYE